MKNRSKAGKNHWCALLTLEELDDKWIGRVICHLMGGKHLVKADFFGKYHLVVNKVLSKFLKNDPSTISTACQRRDIQLILSKKKLLIR